MRARRKYNNRFWFPIAMAVSFLGVTVLAASTVEAKPHWYSGRVIDKKTIPEAARSALRRESETPTSVMPVLFDVVVSLYNNPTGDDDGNTQGHPGSEQQDVYERILQYFADAVYESTDGAHKIRTIRIYRNGRYSSLADIYWDAAGIPGSPTDGISVSGRRIDMFDTFLGVCGPGCDRNLLAHEEGAGYTLGHEWAHYAYGLYDEHAGNEPTSPWDGTPLLGDTPVTPSIMTDHWRAIGGRYKWLNFSIVATQEQGGSDPPWELFEDTSNTAQHRVRGASCWETLARPTSLDPRPPHETSVPSRTYYPELAAVAPAPGARPVWPDLPGTARSDLNIIWMRDTLVYQIVIDHSGSMCGEKVENAKTAAKLLVDLAVEGSSTIGVIQFDDQVEIVAPLTDIPNQAVKSAINAQIDTIVCRGSTAVGDAAQKALDDLLALGTNDDSKVVFLLTDGMSNTGVDPLSVIPAYQAAQIPIFTFAYGADADVAVLEQMASDTGGSMYVSPTTLAAVTRAFEDANLLVSSNSGVTSGTAYLFPGTLVEIPFSVDPTLVRVDATVTHSGNESIASIALVDPNGTAYAPSSVHESASETFRFFSIDMPVEGEWAIQAETGMSMSMSYQVSGVADQVTYSLTAESIGGSTVEYPDPIILMAKLDKGLPIIGASVYASLREPGGLGKDVIMSDDGVPPDANALDGVYSAILNFSRGGQYEFFVKMDNAAGQAALTYSRITAPDIFGSTPQIPPDVPISEDFERFAKLRFNVTGVVADDHGDTTANATRCGVDNGNIAGKIDRVADVDVFSVRVIDAMDGVIVRITNLALGMNPRLRILDGDNETWLCDYTLLDACTKRGYLAVSVPRTVSKDFYVMVSHADQFTGTGTYNISVGSALVEEWPVVQLQPPVVPTSSGGGGGGGGGPCFIATAAYGSTMAKEVATLREFRDRYLLTNAPGKWMVDFYYETSPPIAEYIAERESLRALSRVGLMPIIWMCKIWLKSAALGFAFIVVAVGTPSFAMCVLARRRKGQRLS